MDSSRFRDPRVGAVVTLGAIGLLTAALAPFQDDVGLLNVGLLFLLVTLLVSATWGRGIGIPSALMANLALNYFFVEPLHRLHVAAGRDIFGLGIFLVVSVVGSSLLASAMRSAERAKRRQEQMEVLLNLSRAMIGRTEPADALQAVCEQVTAAYGASGAAVLTRGDGAWRVTASTPDEAAVRALGPEERAMADRAFQQRTIEAAGYTGLAGSRVARIVTRWPSLRERRQGVVVAPIVLGASGLGILRLDAPTGSAAFEDNSKHVLNAFTNEAALALKRLELSREAAQTGALQEANEAKTDLMVSISHDLKTPLAAIKTSVSSLLDHSVDWSEDDVLAFLQTIDSQVDYLDRAISDILDLNRVESGAVRPLLKEVAATELLQDALERAAPMLRGREALIDSDDDLRLDVDASLTAQALVNLIENAAKYSRPGGRVVLRAAALPSGCEISVEDEGPGIPAADLPRIFERYYRSRRQGGEAQGSGLGLALVKAFVELSGGTVWVESQPSGSRFVLRFPATAGAGLSP